jgi:alkylation response protein AidB-like acyl-CoA dehydrogenase
MVTLRTTPSLRTLNWVRTTGLQAGAIIGLPPVLNFGSPELKSRVVPEVFSGKKFICLAISEAFAGSDVMGLKTTAKKTEDGKHWIVTGTKKWITNGQYVTPLYDCCVVLKNLIVLRTISPLGAKLIMASPSFLSNAVKASRQRQSRRAIRLRLEQLMSRLTT